MGLTIQPATIFSYFDIWFAETLCNSVTKFLPHASLVHLSMSVLAFRVEAVQVSVVIALSNRAYIIAL